MKVNWKRFGWCLGIIGVLGLSSCQNEVQEAPKEAPKVTVAHPVVRDIIDYRYYNGWLQATQTVDVRSRVRGHMQKIHFVEGAYVEAGKELFTIDPRPFETVLAEKVADKQAAEARLELATAQYNRTSVLVRTGAASREELDIVTGQKSVATAEVTRAEAAIEKAKLDLDYCVIKAPITGRVSRALVTEGNLVNAGTGEQILTTIVALDPIYAFFNIEERIWQQHVETKKKAGATDAIPSSKDKGNLLKFEFGLEIDESYPYQGVIDFVDNKIEASTGTLQIRGEIVNEKKSLMPGSRIKIRISTTGSRKRFVVPDEAILSDQGRRYLLLVNEKKVVYRKDVLLGQLTEDGQRVLLPSEKPEDELKETDQVIIRGLQRARLDYPVEPLEDKKPDANKAE